MHIILLKCIAIDKIIPKKDFVNILIGDLHRFSAKWKFKLKSYKLLGGEDSYDIQDNINKIISDMLIETTPENLLRITKKGIEYLEDNPEIKKVEKPEKDVSSPSKKKLSHQERMDKIKVKYPNAYEPWTQELDEKLEELYQNGKTVSELCDIFQRQPGGIRSRLKKLELT